MQLYFCNVWFLILTLKLSPMNIENRMSNKSVILKIYDMTLLSPVLYTLHTSLSPKGNAKKSEK